MRILFTGASSFTGYWFVKTLKEAGHEVTAPLFRQKSEYSGIRLERVDHLCELAKTSFGITFGSDPFIDLIRREGTWDLFCHHAADVANYKSPDFDAVGALEKNTRNLQKVLQELSKKGCNRFILTGSVFEQGEGFGSNDLRAVSPYGLSKGLTSSYASYYAAMQGFAFGKFVIPNPFGPYEEPRFTTYLVRNWMEKKAAKVASPAYIRDNIPVDVLSMSYSHFVNDVGRLHEGEQIKKNPSFYRSTQGDFTRMFAEKMRGKLQLACEFELLDQKDFFEPLERVNTEPVDRKALGWDEEQFWAALADYYKKISF